MTDTEGYRVDLDQLEEAERHLQGFVEYCREQVESVRALIAGTAEHWQGTTADAYREQHSSWLDEATQLVKQLDAVRQRLTTAREAYTSVMSTNESMFV